MWEVCLQWSGKCGLTILCEGWFYHFGLGIWSNIKASIVSSGLQLSLRVQIRINRSLSFLLTIECEGEQCSWCSLCYLRWVHVHFEGFTHFVHGINIWGNLYIVLCREKYFFRTYTQHLHFVHSFCCKIFKLGNIYCFHSNYDIINSYFDDFVVKSNSE